MSLTPHLSYCETMLTLGQPLEYTDCFSTHFHHNRDIEFRIILLRVPSPVLLSKFLHHRLHSLGSGNWHRPEFRFHASRIDANLPVPEHVPVSLRVGAPHWQQVQRLAFRHEPDRDRDCLPRLPTDDADLDLAVAGEAVFEGDLWISHSAHGPPTSRPSPTLLASRRYSTSSLLWSSP